MSGEFLPYGRQDIDASDLAAVAEALQSGYLTTGPRVGEFEAAFAKSVGARHAVVSNSGRDTPRIPNTTGTVGTARAMAIS